MCMFACCSVASIFDFLIFERIFENPSREAAHENECDMGGKCTCNSELEYIQAHNTETLEQWQHGM